jgi:cell division GTPase FtsZ
MTGSDAAKRLGVIGLGQCGGNIAALFAARGYPAICANTSASELRSHGLEASRTVQLGNNSDDWRGPISAALDELGEVDLVLAIGGLGGLTGGSLATVVHALSERDMPVVAVGVLPAKTDSFAVKKAALSAINHLVDAPFESLVLIDSQKLHGSYSDRSIDRYLASCNEAVVDAFDRIHRASEQPGLVPLRSFELRSFLSAISGGGVAVFGERELEAPLSHDALLQACVDVVNHNPLLATEYELEDAVTLGTIVVASDDVLRETPVKVFDTYFDEVNMLTGGVTHEVGIYRGDVSKPRAHFIVSGLRLPSMVSRMLSELTDEAARMQEKRAGIAKKLRPLDLGALPAVLDTMPRSIRRFVAPVAPPGRAADDTSPTLPPQVAIGVLPDEPVRAPVPPLPAEASGSLTADRGEVVFELDGVDAELAVLGENIEA